MTLLALLHALALFLTAAVAGGMLAFGAVVAPALFGALPEAEAGKAVRAIFPVYYLVFAVMTVTAAVAAAPGHPWMSVALAAIAGGFLFARQVLTPRINLARDAWTGGEARAKASFDRLHAVSVRLNMAQLVGLVAAFGALALA